ncbi:MAG TPA: tetratricopeptide repeat protein [Polyangiaceae bacterium LLY-WYZ-15_(1-7)]|nr:tetratricopeptide repeat protein [Polyangiaceae bacterium LLY-WYZ-15_(1-7)]HJL12615.1 tetratricopeptide repeat protein [Polyangiaceae bacterium LLY-WYZ-15_(1-7)]HJL26034.1 tetratricopeptide repeat protein [Polyangiaceae bacterium LLY-WYZ-15_(1-7)]HJL28337.1 tetratricopeptide repeat protein [Polyangiaceae bacterium LLY-WYZ-15_(1-7)]
MSRVFASPLPRLVAALLVGAALLTPAPGLAQRNNPLIEQGQELYDELRYEEALQVLSAALVRAGNTEEDRATIYRYLALTYLALGRQEESEGAYRSLLALEPETTPPANISPRFREFFQEATERWEADGRPGVATQQTGEARPAPVNIVHVSPPQADPEESVELRASLEDPDDRVANLVLAYRQGTNDVFRRLDTENVDGEYIATIPGDDVAPPLVEYYFEALDDAGLPVASRGDVAAPLRIAVEAPGEGGVLTKWWFWTIVGAVVVAGAVTTGVVLSRDDGGMPSQGTLIVNVR